MLVGHTHTDIDATFSVFSKKMKDNDAYTMKQLFSFIESLHKIPPKCTELDHIADWRRVVDRYVDKSIVGMSKPNLFKFFMLNGNPVMVYKKYCTDAEWMPEGKPVHWMNFNQTSARASASSSSHGGVSPDRIPDLGLFILDKNIWEYERVNCSRRYLNIELDVAPDGQVPVILRMGATADDLAVDRDVGWNFWYLYSLEDEIDVEPVGEEGDSEPATPEEMTDVWRVVCAKQSWSNADRRHVKLCAMFCLGQPVVPAPIIIDYYGRVRVFNRYTTIVMLFTAVKVDARKMKALFIAREEFRGVTLNSVQAFRSPTVEGALRRFRDPFSHDATLRKEVNFRVDCLVHSQLHYLFDNCDEISWKVEHRDHNLEAVFERRNIVCRRFGDASSSSSTDGSGLLPMPAQVAGTSNAIVPYQAPHNRSYVGGNGQSNGGYNTGNYRNVGSSNDQRYSRNWNGGYGDRDNDDRFNRIYGLLAEQAEERQQRKREASELVSLEEDKKRLQVEEMNRCEEKERELQEARLGHIVRSSMKVVCESALGRKVDLPGDEESEVSKLRKELRNSNRSVVTPVPSGINCCENLTFISGVVYLGGQELTGVEETESSIRFASKEDGCTPRGVAGFNETQSQELLKLTLEFGGLGDRESIGCLVVNTIVRHKLDGVFDVAHRWDVDVRERRWENVMVLSNEVTNCGLQVSRISCEFLSVSVSSRRQGGLDGRRRVGSRDGSHGDRRSIWLQRDELGVGTGWIIV
ncbi:hypothetical protein CBR_g18784 [Chara braunii]|uniref:DUF7869 domain-containing protein n=1 Tax=Chara braunii TaxID=69332 RepID=A0A388KWN7_CHABU|nr:hypothetical protein CBR_g18784 [Chara braunii]|eukprot:GBG74373.1 hypothetical protein CBR_g18784 [Chara braunii]